MILAVNVGTAACFFMPGLFTKTGSCWSGKGGDLIVQPSYPCRNVFAWCSHCLEPANPPSLPGWSALLGLNVRDTVLPRADKVSLRSWKGPALYILETKNAVLATSVKLTLCTSWTWCSDSQEVLGSHRCLWHAVDTSRFCPRCVAHSRSEKSPLCPGCLQSVCNLQPSRCCHGRTVCPGPTNSDYFSENNLMQSAETWGLRLPHPPAQIHTLLQPSSFCHGFGKWADTCKTTVACQPLGMVTNVAFSSSA